MFPLASVRGSTRLPPRRASSSCSHSDAEKPSWIEEHLRRVECVYFVPSRKESGRCGCGRMYEQHELLVAHPTTVRRNIRWGSEKHTAEFPTDAFGTVEFQGGPHPSKARYVRLSATTNPQLVLQLLFQEWNLRVPNLVISVFGGLADFDLQPKLKHVFQMGLMKAATTTGAWIITNGLDTGVAKHVGDATSNHALYNDSNVVALGIAPWSVVLHREHLKGKDINVPYYSISSPFKREAVLNKGHTHFLLCDNGTYEKYGCELQLRRMLEQFMAHQYIDMRKHGGIKSRVPLVAVLVEGGPHSFSTVYQLVTDINPIPVVICEGSGRASDIMACAYKNSDDKGKLSADIKDQLILLMMRAFKTKKVVAEELCREMEYCLKYKNLIGVFQMTDDTNADIDNAILTALLDASADRLTPAGELSLTMAWNRPDIALSKVLTFDRIWKPHVLENAMFDALVNDRLEFVKLLLENGVSMTSFLTEFRLEQLYNTPEIPANARFLKRLHERLRSKEAFSLRLVGRYIESIVGGGYKHIYCHKTSKPHLLNYERRTETSFQTMSDVTDVSNTANWGQMSGGFHFRYPYTQLMQWALLTQRYEIARYMIFCGEESIAKALMATKLCSSIRKTLVKELAFDYYQELKRWEGEFESYAVKLQEFCYVINQAETVRLLTYELNEFSKHTCLSLAYLCHSKAFLGLPCTQSILSDLWYGGLQQCRFIDLRVTLALLCSYTVVLWPLLALLIGRYRLLRFKTKKELSQQPQTLEEYLAELCNSSSSSSSGSSSDEEGRGSCSSIANPKPYLSRSIETLENKENIALKSSVMLPSEDCRSPRAIDLQLPADGQDYVMGDAFVIRIDPPEGVCSEETDSFHTTILLTRHHSCPTISPNNVGASVHGLHVSSANDSSSTSPFHDRKVSSVMQKRRRTVSSGRTRDQHLHSNVNELQNFQRHVRREGDNQLSIPTPIPDDALSSCSSALEASAQEDTEVDVEKDGVAALPVKRKHHHRYRRRRLTIVGKDGQITLNVNPDRAYEVNELLGSNRFVRSHENLLNLPTQHRETVSKGIAFHTSSTAPLFSSSTRPILNGSQMSSILIRSVRAMDSDENTVSPQNDMVHSHGRSKGQLSLRRKIYEFFNAPITRYYLHLSFFLLFLGCIVYISSVYISHNVFHPVEVAAHSYVYVYFFDKFREVYHTSGSNPMARLKNHLSIFWNVYDYAVCACSMMAFIFRYISLFTLYFYDATRAWFSFCTALWILRMLDLMKIWEFMGPTIYMCREMIKQMMPLVVLLFLSMLAFGIIRQGLMYSYKNPQFTINTIKDILMKPYFMLYGELYDDEIDPATWQPPASEEPLGWIVPVTMAIFLILITYLIISVLFARFNDVYRSVRSESELVHKFLRYAFIIEYEAMPLLPPPFTVFNWVYDIMEYCCNVRRMQEAHPERSLSTEGLKLFLSKEEIEKLHDFEEECVERYNREFHRNQSKDKDKSMKAISGCIAEMFYQLDDIYHRQHFTKMNMLEELSAMEKNTELRFLELFSNFPKASRNKRRKHMKKSKHSTTPGSSRHRRFGISQESLDASQKYNALNVQVSGLTDWEFDEPVTEVITYRQARQGRKVSTNSTVPDEDEEEQPPRYANNSAESIIGKTDPPIGRLKQSKSSVKTPVDIALLRNTSIHNLNRQFSQASSGGRKRSPREPFIRSLVEDPTSRISMLNFSSVIGTSQWRSAVNPLGDYTTICDDIDVSALRAMGSSSSSQSGSLSNLGEDVYRQDPEERQQELLLVEQNEREQIGGAVLRRIRHQSVGLGWSELSHLDSDVDGGGSPVMQSAFSVPDMVAVQRSRDNREDSADEILIHNSSWLRSDESPMQNHCDDLSAFETDTNAANSALDVNVAPPTTNLALSPYSVYFKLAFSDEEDVHSYGSNNLPPPDPIC